MIIGKDGKLTNKHEYFQKIEFTTAELKKLPKVHAGFLVGSCLAVNDISIVQKTLLLAQNTRVGHWPTDSEALQEVAFAQALVLERNLSAKVFEYLKMLCDYIKRCDRVGDSNMQAFTELAKSELSTLKQGENYNLAKWYRDKATNHYIISEFSSIIDNDNSSNNYSIYLHEKDGNSSYLLGEQFLVFEKFCRNGEFFSEEMEEFIDWILEASAKITKLHNEFCIQIFKVFLPEKGAKAITASFQQHHVGKIRGTCLPILWNFQDMEEF